MQQKESKTTYHFTISLIKSAVRIGACYFLATGNYYVSALLFGGAEILGIVEEL